MDSIGHKVCQGGARLRRPKRIEISLDQHLTEENIRIRGEKRGAIVARCYQSHVEGCEVSDDDVHTWIELVRE